MGDKPAFDPNRVKAHCPNCGPDRWAVVVGYYAKHDEDDESGIWFHTDHRLLQCPACEEVYHQTVSVFSEDLHPVHGSDGTEWEYDKVIRHWPEVPQIAKKKPDWIPKLAARDLILEDLMESVYKALNSGLPLFSVIGVRTLLDRATEVLQIDPAKTFAEKLSDLEAGGFIGQTEKDILSITIDAGSAAAHRGWKPSDEQLALLLDTIEGFLYRVFILRDDVTKLKAAIPPKPKRQPKAAST